MIDIILFAAIAAFLGYRLYSALGNKDYSVGSVSNKPAPKTHEPNVRDANFTVVKQADDSLLDAKYGKELADKVRGIVAIDPNFTLEGFLYGAKKAFEIILKGFSADDKETLKSLLSQEIFDSFVKIIEQRKDREEIEETTLVSILDAVVKDIALHDKYAEISVHITSEQINLTRDRQGKIVSGNPSQVDKVSEIWTFGRDLKSASPNWELLETAAV